MFIRQTFRTKNGQRHAYWALVESYRTASGPRQRVVAWLGKLDDAGRLGVLRAAEEAKQSAAQHEQHGRQQPLNHQLQFEFDDDPTPQPRWVEVNAAGVRVENLRQFGGPWIALHLIRTLQLDTFLQNVMEDGSESVPWDVTSLILIIARLLEPSSELYVSEQWYPKSSLTEAEAAFRIHKSDLSLRPIWHQKEDRVLAHIFVCFVAYVLWKTLGQMSSKAGLGNEARRILAELSDIRSMDVVLPTRSGPEIRTRCISKPTDHQQILLEKLGLRLPAKIIQRKL